MNTRVRFFVAASCVAMLIPEAARAQGRERYAFTYTHEEAAALEGGGDLTLHETEVRMGLPPLWRDGARMVTLGLRWTMYDFLSSDQQVDDFTAHSIRFPIRGAITRSNEWSWSAVLTPSIRSDFDGFTADDLGINGLALGTYPWRPAWNVSAGLVYGQNFGRSRFFPALGAVWTPNPDWQVDLIFPRPRATYAASSNVTVNATLEPGGDEWNIDLDGETRDLALEEYRAGLGVDLRLARNLFLITQAGYVFNRNLEVRDGSRKEFDRDIDDTWFARIGLAYR